MTRVFLPAVLTAVTLLATACGDGTTEPEGPSLTGTWEGTEEADFLPYDWRFEITDNQGRLSGTYGVRALLGYDDWTGSLTGSWQGSDVTISPSGDYRGTFEGTVSGETMNGTIEYGDDDTDLGPYGLTLRRTSR